MSKGLYAGVGNSAKKGTKIYVGVGGVAKKVAKGYIGVGGVARQFYSAGVAAGSLSVGDSVFLNVDGVPREFLVVHQGNPNTSFYDDSCTGTWLLMKDIHKNATWAVNNATTRPMMSQCYASTYYNGEFLDSLDADVRAALVEAKMPYHHYNGTVYNKSNGYPFKVFLLSTWEVGIVPDTFLAYEPRDGYTLDYFVGTLASGYADPKRVATLNGTPARWWMRSLFKAGTDTGTVNGQMINADGSTGGVGLGVTSSAGHRPAFILPQDFVFAKAG